VSKNAYILYAQQIVFVIRATMDIWRVKHNPCPCVSSCSTTFNKRFSSLECVWILCWTCLN